MLGSYILDIVVGLLILFVLVLLIRQYYHCRYVDEKQLHSYGYTDFDGPHTWKYRFRIKGENQSPINVLSVCALVVQAESIAPLDFSPEYHIVPLEMRMVNDGYTVVIYCNWVNAKRPILCGGPLCNEYKFFCMRFRWGPNDEEGSEHMIDMRRYAVELQVSYNKCSCKCTDLSKSARTCAVVIISYVFEVTEVDNPYFDPIMDGLHFINSPCKAFNLRPMPVSVLAPKFNRRYFSYMGSLTYPPCTEGVRWIIQPEPLTISARQVQEFRKLTGYQGTILNNTRPVQNINSRDVIFYE